MGSKSVCWVAGIMDTSSYEGSSGGYGACSRLETVGEHGNGMSQGWSRLI